MGFTRWLALGGFTLAVVVQACASDDDGSEQVPYSEDAANLPDVHTAADAGPDVGGACEPGFITQVLGPSTDEQGNTAPLYGSAAGFGQDRYPDVIVGPPRGETTHAGSLDVLSLGKGGEIIVGFEHEGITDKPGADFIVFENVLYELGDETKPYAELAEVSVSSDMQTWHTFPCQRDAYPFSGCAGWHATLSHPDNGISPFDPDAAGGEAFDLAELGVTEVRAVRLRDLDNAGFGGTTAGFDLDAIAVVHPNCPTL